MSYKIISKFIKDISFEIPNIQAFVLLEKELPKYSLNFAIKSNPYKDKIIEINTILKITPPQNVKHKILAEINLCALVSIEDDFMKYEQLEENEKEKLEKIILINVPQEIYPTLYKTFVYLFEQAGIKNVQIHKEVDFEKMYKSRKK